MEENKKKYYVPIWKKSNLTIEEAVAYSGIGRDKLRDMTSIVSIHNTSEYSLFFLHFLIV